MPFIELSVVITTFNMEKFIKRALDSVLSQKVNFNIEIIVSDDCSTDQTLNILEEFKGQHGKKIIILSSQYNIGVVLNCKRALKAAKGKYIALLDADDYWVNDNKLQKQFDILENTPSIGFVYTNFRYINENGILGGHGIKKSFIPPQKGNFVLYLLSPYISPSCICFKKSIVNFQLFDTIFSNKYASQEYALFLDFTSKELGYYLDEITMHYTVRKESLSRKTNYRDKIKTSYSAFETANSFIKEHPIEENINNKRVFNFYLKILLTAWESNNISIIKKYTTKLSLSQFLKYNPKASYIYIASKNKLLYKLLRPWVLRKRPPGK